MNPDPAPFEVEMMATIVPRDPARSFRVVRIVLRRSWFRRVWRRLRAWFTGPT